MTTRAAFLKQAEECEAMGSPFNARLLRVLARRLTPVGTVSEMVLNWPLDPSGRASALPLRLAGALHGLVLSGADAGLTMVYPPDHERASDADIWMAVESAFLEHESEILTWLDSPPQTNEPRRTGALVPGFLTVAARTGQHLVTSELGASAGLNLNWDAFDYRFGSLPWGRADSTVEIRPDWTGPPPPIPPVRVIERAGCDRAPIDPENAADQLRLLSYVWPDQTHRLLMTASALDLARQSPVRVKKADATDWLEQRLAQSYPGCAHVIYHSLVWSYLSEDAQRRCQALLESAGSMADKNAPLAWLRMEGDGQEPGAAINLTLWPGGNTRQLGRCGFHGEWVNWTGWR